MNRKWIIGLGALALAGTVALATVALQWNRFDGRINALGVDLRQPMAYIGTASLSALPRDLVKAPVLREFLTEDFAFYYEEHEDRLGLGGALRRIAFEHQPTLADNLIELALDEPAEVALWTDGKGAPRHWAMAMTRGSVARALQGLAAVAAKDKQLTLIGALKSSLFGWSSQPVYALALSPRRTLAIATRGNRVVVLSDPGLLFNAERQADPQAAQVLESLLSGDDGAQALWRQHFGLGAPGAGHTLVAGGTLLSFGYQHFFPSLQALRVDLAPGGRNLRSFVRRSAAAPAGPAPWPALPAQAAACALLPVDWARTKAVLSDTATAAPAASAAGSEPAPDRKAALSAMADAFDGPAAICWYERSQLHTPLLVAHAKGAAPGAAVLANFAQWWLPTAAELSGEAASGTQARVNAPYGALREGDNSAYQSRFARAGDWWVFSPDGELVEQAQASIARRYPSLADTLGERPGTLALVAPQQVAELLRREALAVITPQQASFRQAADQQLLPRLAAFGKLPASHALPQGAADAQGWQALDWQPLKAAR
ncbi:DUF2138 family protein [Aquabacterium sp.]|uniref:DUF2138 family protein n=1 Tax=Aquabacterium sp. TaxID=1872578 RepID=UPI002CF1C697|nr:DUF2138 family protein [Aquabacterium sp.]HSW08589.1 DUF2138 family protein [Aquabacterium sp.]